MRRTLLIVGFFAVGAIEGCSAFGAAGDDAGVEAGVADAAVADREGGTACSGLHGSKGVRLGGYCIDMNEVTRAQYRQFMDAQVPFANQPPACAGNTSYTPSREWGADGGEGGTELYPVVGVDWCDAYAFCKWDGKRLCGRIGGGAVLLTERNDAQKSEWYAACTTNGTSTFPYGTAYDPTKCNGATDGGGVELVSAHPGCTTDSGILDMSGNAYEWEDSCNGEAPDAPCQLRGGDYSTPQGRLRCDGDGTQPRNDRARWGIRCCSD